MMKSGAHSSEERVLVQKTSWTRLQSLRRLRQIQARRQKVPSSALTFRFVATRHLPALTAATAQTDLERAEEAAVVDEVVSVKAEKEVSDESVAHRGITLRVELLRVLPLVARDHPVEAVEAVVVEEASEGMEEARDALTAKVKVEVVSEVVVEDSVEVVEALKVAQLCHYQATLVTPINVLVT